MARALGCHQSTISRELRRNSTDELNKTTRVNNSNIAKLDGRHYRGREIVNIIYQQRDSFRKRKQLFQHNKSRYAANDAEEIHDRLIALNIMFMLIGLPQILPVISHRAIYKYIKEHPEKNLTGYLRRKGRTYRYQSATTFNTTNREKHSIHDRPDEVDKLNTYGNGEGDTMVGLDKKDRLLTHVERISGVGSISLVIGFDSQKISNATKCDVERVFGDDLKTITYDNGVEFSGWRETEKKLGATIYFADPYKSCQRGRNENFNGLVREYFPKGTDFKKLTKNDIIKVESLINNRPRKRFLGFTPLEVQWWLRFMQLGC